MPRHTFSILRQALVISLTAAGWSGAAVAARTCATRSDLLGARAVRALGGCGLDRLLDPVGASGEQRAQITQIAAQARADLATERELGLALHEQALQWFAQPALDGAARARREAGGHAGARRDDGHRRGPAAR